MNDREISQLRTDNQRIGRNEAYIENQWFVSFAMFVIGLMIIPTLFGLIILITRFKIMIWW